MVEEGEGVGEVWDSADFVGEVFEFEEDLGVELGGVGLVYEGLELFGEFLGAGLVAGLGFGGSGSGWSGWVAFAGAGVGGSVGVFGCFDLCDDLAGFGVA